MATKGRKPKHPPEFYDSIREGVNHLYYNTDCSIARIARHYEISAPKVHELLMPKQHWLAISSESARSSAQHGGIAPLPAQPLPAEQQAAE